MGALIGTLDHPRDWPPDRRHNGIECKVSWLAIHNDLSQVRIDD